MLTTRKRKDIIRKFVTEFNKKCKEAHEPFEVKKEKTEMDKILEKLINTEPCYELWKNYDSMDNQGEFHAFDTFGYTGIYGKGIFIVEETYEDCVETFEKTYPDLKKDLDLGLPEFEEYRGVWICYH